jgi:methionine-rich copper-binding protein CopC
VKAQRLALWALITGLLAFRPAPAHAHAFLDHAEPRVGSTVRSPPSGVTLAFTEPIEAAFSRVEVLDGSGKRIETGPAEHPTPDTLKVSLPTLVPGEYRVRWSVVSVDTHATEGSFTFSVKGP